MLFFLLFIVLMPALTYADYRLYGKKMKRPWPPSRITTKTAKTTMPCWPS